MSRILRTTVIGFICRSCTYFTHHFRSFKKSRFSRTQAAQAKPFIPLQIIVTRLKSPQFLGLIDASTLFLWVKGDAILNKQSMK